MHFMWALEKYFALYFRYVRKSSLDHSFVSIYVRSDARDKLRPVRLTGAIHIRRGVCADKRSLRLRDRRAYRTVL